MISKLFAEEQVRRLKAVNHWIDSEDNKEQFNNLAKALLLCDSETVAYRVISEIIEGDDDIPSVAEVRRRCEAVNADQRKKHGNVCRICDGNGFVVIERNGLTGAQPCVCLPATHHAHIDPREHEYWKPHWKYDRQDTK